MLEHDSIASLRAGMSGRLIGREHPDFEGARRVWNGMIDKRPHLIVEAGGVGDIVSTIALARKTGLPLAVRGGGHGVAGHGTVDDGIVLDLGQLARVEVDPTARLVHVQAGATLRDVDASTQPHALAVPLGVVSATGIAGLTLGGGVGWLTRRHGLTLDSLVAADVVLATGERVRASAEENPDLFWALRGGGGNFGVVSSFTFHAYPLGPQVFAGTLVYEREHWQTALRAYAAWAAATPDAMTTVITLMVPPPQWDLGDRVLMLVGFAWSGEDTAAGQREIDRLRAACDPDAAVTGMTPWMEVQSAFDEIMPAGVRAYWRNAWFRELDETVLAAVIERCGEQTWFGTGVDLHHMGGAFGRRPEGSTAFPGRSAGFWLNCYGFWASPADDDERVAWIKHFSDGLRPVAMGAQYLNFLGADSGSQVADEIWDAEKFARLKAVKRRYDPGNIFRINHNIPPVR